MLPGLRSRLHTFGLVLGAVNQQAAPVTQQLKPALTSSRDCDLLSFRHSAFPWSSVIITTLASSCLVMLIINAFTPFAVYLCALLTSQDEWGLVRGAAITGQRASVFEGFDFRRRCRLDGLVQTS